MQGRPGGVPTRFLSQGRQSKRHVGNKLCGAQAATMEPSEPLRVKPIFVARGDRSYLLAGGLGGIGLALAVWLSQRGARHIILSSKRCAGSAAGVFYYCVPAKCHEALPVYTHRVASKPSTECFHALSCAGMLPGDWALPCSCSSLQMLP